MKNTTVLLPIEKKKKSNDTKIAFDIIPGTLKIRKYSFFLTIRRLIFSNASARFFTIV